MLQLWERCMNMPSTCRANSFFIEAVLTITVMPWPSRLDHTPPDRRGHGKAINKLSRLGSHSAPTCANALLRLVPHCHVIREWNVAAQAVKIQVEGNANFSCISRFLWPITCVCINCYNSSCSLFFDILRIDLELVWWPEKCAAGPFEEIALWHLSMWIYLPLPIGLFLWWC